MSTPEEVASPTVPGAAETPAPARLSPRDSLLLDLPPVDTAQDARTAQAIQEKLKAVEAGYLLKEQEELPTRSLPWVVDIFLYPLNKQALLIVTLSTAIPFVLHVLQVLCSGLAMAFPPALILLVVSFLAHWGSLLMFVLYVNWYAVECIRDSAAGGIRAVDTSGSTPGVAELAWQTLASLTCVVGCMMPAMLWASSGGSPVISWLLCGIGGFFVPIALLAVTLFESLRALNPVLLLGSVFSTFTRYCVLAIFCIALCLPVPIAFRYLIGDLWHLGYALLFVAFYLLLVAAHLVGCFYHKNEGRLNWDA